jgi:hypothetical protein
MMTRMPTLAFAALATATAALLPTGAFAFGHGYGMSHHMGGFGHKFGWHDHDHDHYRWGFYGHYPRYGWRHDRWGRRYVGSYPVPSSFGDGGASDSSPPPASPGCLTKGYLPDGSAVFTDRCAQESAIVGQSGPDAPPQPMRRFGRQNGG